jgi:hypothetical protein
MDSEANFQHRRAMARTFAIFFVIGWGLLIFLARPAEAQPRTPATPVVAPATDVAPNLAGTSLFRLEWFSHCNPAQPQLGLYAPTDGACTPSHTPTLNWLQSQMVVAGLINSSEYLERFQHPNLAACQAAVFGAGDQLTGWICLEAHGVLRTDVLGQSVLARAWLQTDGQWVTAR